VRHPEQVRRLVGGVHMDMVGGLLATTKGTFHLSRTAASRPHVLDVVAQAFFDDVVSTSARYAERGGDPRAGLVWLPGSREAFLGDVRDFELGSDHQVFEEASFGVPFAYFHDWPDVTIHTNKDQPENLDATKLGRVVYMGAGIAWTLAALPDAEAGHLLAVARASVDERLRAAELRAELAAGDPDAALFPREAAAMGRALLDSIGVLWPSVARSASEAGGSLAPHAALASRSATDARHARVPLRQAGIRGPLQVYYYDHLTETLGGRPELALLGRPSGDLLAYEALNLVDGRRSVAEVRDVLAGRYQPVPLADVSQYFELLVRAGVLSWR
jgi:hypothetical protein